MTDEGAGRKLATARAVKEACVAQGLSFADASALAGIGAPETLFVIGNGFDLVHGVKSSYWDFQSTLGKSNQLRAALEVALIGDDLWGDFENNLAHINTYGMLSNLDDMIDVYDAYSEDASAADLFAAAEETMWPLQSIVHDLPRRFHMWVNTLQPGKHMALFEEAFSKISRYLTFNYTEFLESVYGIPESRIAYIHGKRDTKGKGALVLGHAPDAGTEDGRRPRLPHYRSAAKREKLEAALLVAQNWVNWYHEDFTKDTADIIRAHASFFDMLSEVRDVVVVGHSLSAVDMPYYFEMRSRIRRFEQVHWFFSCHTADSVSRVTQFLVAMGIEPSNAAVFAL